MKNNLSEVWDEINDQVIDLTFKFYNQHSKLYNFLIAFYNKLLKTNKLESFFKKKVSYEIFNYLKDSYLNNKDRLKFRSNFFILIYYYLWLSKQIFTRGFCFLKKREKFFFSRESTWNFKNSTLRDDLLVDGKNIKKEEIIFYEAIAWDKSRKKAFLEAKNKGFKTVSFKDLKININYNFFKIFKFYFIIPFYIFLYLSIKKGGFLFNQIISLHRECFISELFMSLYDIKYNISTDDIDDIAKTIIFNKYGTKNILFHWSDLTYGKVFPHFFIAHNIYFIWGKEHLKYYQDSFQTNEIVEVGCIFNKCLKNLTLNKEELKYNGNSKKVVFFDNSFGDDNRFSEDFFLEYLELINEFCIKNKDKIIFLKPKSDYENTKALLSLENFKKFESVYNNLKNNSNFIYLNPNKFSIDEAVKLSDIIISMGMSTTSTIALLNGKLAFYYDKNPSKYSFIALKYENVLVFNDKEELLKQVDFVIKNNLNYKELIKEEDLILLDSFRDEKALDRMQEVLLRDGKL